MKMRIDGIKELFLEEILPVMENHSFRFLRSKDTFVHENNEWKNECVLRFSELKDGRVSLRTEYLVTSKKISDLYEKATQKKDKIPTCGVTDVTWAYNYLGVPLEGEPCFEIDAAAIDSIVRRWVVEFESVGLVFLNKMNDYKELAEILDIFNVSGWPPLCIWPGERILHGICLYYLENLDKEKTLELFSLYKRKVKDVNFRVIGYQFELLEKYIKSLPDLKG